MQDSELATDEPPPQHVSKTQVVSSYQGPIQD